MKHTASLTQGNILQVLLRFSIPFLLANLLQALYGAADLMIIGAYCPAESIAAVSTGTLGATILVAKYAGRQQPDKIEKTIGTTITFFALFSIILSLILAFSTGMILQLLQVPQASMAQAYEYVFICITGIFFICEYNAFSALLRGYGDSISPLLFVAAACVCNIAGDLFTSYGSSRNGDIHGCLTGNQHADRDMVYATSGFSPSLFKTLSEAG